MTLATLVGRTLQAVLWIALVGFLVLLGLSRITPLEVLVVRSGSMEPAMPTGGVVIVDRSARAPGVGEVASFREPDGSVVTHRIVAIDGLRYVTKGDANEANDPIHRPRTAVYGTVLVALPFLGYAVHLLQQPIAFLVLLLGTGGFLIVASLRTIAEELSRMRHEREPTDAT